MVAAEAYAACARLAREHYENFPVASRLLPPAMRPHIAAIYAFARTADDFADEGDLPPEERLARLDGWERALRTAAAGQPVPADDERTRAVFVALAETMRVCRLDEQPFLDLLSAFRQDVLVHRYESWNNLLDYCRRSANPVGRLVLAVAGVRDERADAESDALCTALQLTNFWQDLARDWRNGRVYVPAELARATGADERDLARGQLTGAWREALAEASRRTRELFAAGRGVADRVPGRLRWELRMTWLGGVRILTALEARDFDVFDARPVLGPADAAAIVFGAVVWRFR